ncbi:uncharacterized protein conserved in bacteria [Paenibacillus popilliae ATCC 14706]|uniref:Uncharacterized protein conserved in bacteria n=1 Tax=Paenibacillus popilliae ATCC 14706 TaxID=1212764 RepID=M9M590_PAEPP|nr:uncharacterized protein conserved in bacteria [Paenibacillus popilliae ATCC 14706]
MRGLKFICEDCIDNSTFVASYVDAWIEMLMLSLLVSVVDVASYVDAWIEIYMILAVSNGGYTSHPMWMRGLKY